ncbi:MAG: rhodanese-like domain-containing protein, partial [Planctomycetes bacterium]|nr:rhodanese-like domain-containing protein [Planctomycetota bacterium]
HDDSACEEPEGTDEWEEDDIKYISLKRALELHEMVADGNAAFLDARKEEDYAEGHIAGALPVYHAQRERLLEPHLEKLKNDVAFIVVYCPGGDCEDSIYLTNALIEEYGFVRDNIFVLKCGYSHWEKRGYPTEKGR